MYQTTFLYTSTKRLTLKLNHAKYFKTYNHSHPYEICSNIGHYWLHVRWTSHRDMTSEAEIGGNKMVKIIEQLLTCPTHNLKVR